MNGHYMTVSKSLILRLFWLVTSAQQPIIGLGGVGITNVILFYRNRHYYYYYY